MLSSPPSITCSQLFSSHVLSTLLESPCHLFPSFRTSYPPLLFLFSPYLPFPCHSRSPAIFFCSCSVLSWVFPCRQFLCCIFFCDLIVWSGEATSQMKRLLWYTPLLVLFTPRLQEQLLKLRIRKKKIGKYNWIRCYQVRQGVWRHVHASWKTFQNNVIIARIEALIHKQNYWTSQCMFVVSSSNFDFNLIIQ